MSNSTAINIEKEVLMHYRHIAGTIIQKHINRFGESTEGSIQKVQDIHHRLRSINSELTANAEKLLNEIKGNSCIDHQKLQEHLFIIRKDYFNDFLKKTQFNPAL